jgi:acyl transferase domain-containing protein
LILKPLEHALRDGDNIRTIIRETAVNQNGKTPTITSPSLEGQVNIIKACYARAGLDPAETAYVEAHMTGQSSIRDGISRHWNVWNWLKRRLGTVAGDPIEASAIGQVFGAGRSHQSPVLVGSIKTNLGHTEASSGLAGVIKTVLALEKGLIPPNLNFETPNPAIDMKMLNIKVMLTIYYEYSTLIYGDWLQ